MGRDGTMPLHITISPRRAGSASGGAGGVLESNVRLRLTPTLHEREFLAGITECRLLSGAAYRPGGGPGQTLDLLLEVDYQVAAPFRPPTARCLGLPVRVQLAPAGGEQLRFAPTLCRLDWARAVADRQSLSAGLTLVLEPAPAESGPPDGTTAGVRHRRKRPG